MPTFRNDDTIAALSTPPGQSGIAVVRMSGAFSLDILERLFQQMSGHAFPGDWEHRRLYHGRLLDPRGVAVDDVMCAVMRAPETYTGEDVVEISCHGGPVVVARTLEALFDAGARPAGPGEFTRRAFLNGKMDLIQAEAVADLIHARSELQREVAHRQLAGGLSKRIGGLADEALSLLGEIEANIDFIEEGIEALDRSAARAVLARQRAALAEMLGGAALAGPFREGFRVVMAGPVNAGKSSLFNRLLGEERAIVTEIPGTTRDVLREPIILGGLLFLLQDTAGLRQPTGDRVESIGMGLAADAARTADVVVFVVDRSAAPDPALERAVGSLDPSRAILVLNKADLAPHPGVSTLEDLGSGLECVTLSARRGEGLDRLEASLVARVGGEDLVRVARERVVVNARLAALLRRAQAQTDRLDAGLRDGHPLEILAVEARELLSAYEEATGRSYREDLLDVIFSRFCIGK